jgi:hypothetical protein
MSNAEIGASRCPGCGHSCCPRKGLECGGESDVVQACEHPAGVSCAGCGLPLAWPLGHAACTDLPRVITPGQEVGE